MIYLLMSASADAVRQIFEGSKTLEIRKTAPESSGPYCVILYERRQGNGRGKIVGWFRCPHIGTLHKISVREACSRACLCRSELCRYAADSRRDVPQLRTWEIESPRELVTPIPLPKALAPCPPESWRTLKPGAALAVLDLPSRTIRSSLPLTAK